MKQCFKPKAFGAERLATVAAANKIIAEYQAGGYRLTLRQLYYQFVSRDLIPNTQRSYKNLGTAINEGRLAGLIDWSVIEDRGRQPKLPREWDDVEDLVSAAVHGYRLPRWHGQENYVELWVEKDALSGVLAPMADEFHVTLAVNKGYSSQSAMYEAGMRLGRKLEAHDQAYVLYLGDLDPSGEDMVRDVRDRLSMFGAEVEVEKLALTMEQVEEHEPPPNPVKSTDSRSGTYEAEHGSECWEVDALPPDVLTALIRGRLSELVDQEKVDEIMEREEKDKAALVKAAKRINKD